MNFKPPFYLVFSEATLFVIEQREEESLSGSLSEDMKGLSQEALKAFPSFVYTRILWPIDIVLVDCHECYGRKILEWSMYIKIQYLDSIGIPQKNKKWKRKNKCRRGKRKWDQGMGSLSPQSYLTDCCSNWSSGIHFLTLSSHPKIWTAIFKTTSRKKFLRALKIPWARFCKEVKILHYERPKIKGTVFLLSDSMRTRWKQYEFLILLDKIYGL